MRKYSITDFVGFPYFYLPHLKEMLAKNKGQNL